MKNLKLIMLIFCNYIFVLTTSAAKFESGEIQGIVTDSTTGKPVLFASVSIVKGDEIISGVMADEEGRYKIKPLMPGTYTVKATFQSYNISIINHVVVEANHITFCDVKLSSTISLPVAQVSSYRNPLINKDNVTVGTTLNATDIKASPYTEIKDFVASTPGTVQKEEGGTINVRGSRGETTQYIIDGVRVIGGFSLPKSAIESISVISGGVPAQYGDATGGIVVITTKSFFTR